MASKNFSGVLRDPLGDLASKDKYRFTHVSTTGEVIRGSTSYLNIGNDGVYDIDIEYGNVTIDSYSQLGKRWINQGTTTINADTVVTTLPALLNALVPASEPLLLELQALLADAEQAASDAADSAAEAAANEGVALQNRQAIEAVYKAQGYNNVFFFEDGFTYTESNDVGVYEDGTAWTYADSGALPVAVAAGTVPSEGVYKGVKVALPPFDTVADMESATYLSTLPEDTNIVWNGYYVKGDGGGNSGLLKFGAHTEDGGSIFSVGANTYIEANLKGRKVSVLKFGALANDNSKGVHNFSAIRAALKFCLLKSESIVWDAIEKQSTLNFPAGEYFITGNSPLRISGQELVASGSMSGYRRGLNITGDGVASTMLTLSSDTGDDVWFYDSTDGETSPPTWGYQFNHYSGITFRDDKSRDNPNDQRVVGSKVGGWNLESAGWEGWPEWSDCQLSSLDTILRLTGAANDDHIRWTNVKVNACRDHVFYVDNNQSVGHVLIGCEINCSGDVFRILSGGWAYMEGGSVIINERTVGGLPAKDPTIRGFFHYNPTGASSGGQYRNQSFAFKGLTFETYDEYNRIVHCEGDSQNSMVNVKFEDCSWATEAEVPSGGGQAVTASWDRRDAFNLEGEHNAFVTLTRCDLQGRHEYKIHNKSQVWSSSWIRFNQCQVGWQINTTAMPTGGSLSGRCYADTSRGGIQAHGTTWKAQSQTLYRNYAQDFNKIPKPADCGLQPMTFEASLYSDGDIWPDTNGNQTRLYLPESAFVWKSSIFKSEWEPSSPTANYGINLKRSLDATTILSYGGNGDEGRGFINESVLTVPYKISNSNEYVYLSLSGSASEGHPREGFCSVFYR